MASARWLVGAVLMFPLVAAVGACGSRGPLDIGPDETNGTLDASDQVDGALPGDATNGDDGSVTPNDGSVTPVDAARPQDAGRDAPRFEIDTGVPALNCGLCVGQACGTEIFACLQDTGCRQTLTCVTQQCLAGGTPSPTCVLGCASGNPGSVVQILKIFQCIITSCGQDCIGLIGGGGGGGGGGGRDAGRMPNAPANGAMSEERRAIVNDAFSAWPELCSRE